MFLVASLKRVQKKVGERMSLLTNAEKLYVLYTKGHFGKYKNAKQVILGEIYDLEPEQITNHIAENFMVELFVKLTNVRAIEMNYNESIAWLLNEFREIGSRPMASESLHDWLYNKIAHALPTHLDLDNVVRTIEQKMKLEQEWIVVTNCLHYESPIFETKQEVMMGNWVYADPYEFIWSSSSFENVYQVIEAAESMYPGDFFIGQRIANDVVNINRIRKV